MIRSTCPQWNPDHATLCFWIPLRRSKSGTRPLAQECKGDDVPKFAAELGSLWDRFWRLLAGAEHLQRLHLVLPDDSRFAEIHGSSSRLWRSTPEGGVAERAAEISIRIVSGGVEMVAAGAQAFVQSATPLVGTGDWPTTPCMSDDEPEKPMHLEPLSGAYLIGPSGPESLANLEVVGADWACWFPLSGADRIDHADQARLRIVLHGAFHVASDRKSFSVAGRDGGGPSATERWNADLALEGAAASVPDAIRRYVETVGLSGLAELTCFTVKLATALRSLTSPSPTDFTSSFDAALGAKAVWGPFLDLEAPEGVTYRCVESTHRIWRLELRRPSVDGRALLDALPGLAKLAGADGSAILCMANHGAGCVGEPRLTPWGRDEWTTVLEGLEPAGLSAFTSFLEATKARTALAGSDPDDVARVSILAYLRSCIRELGPCPAIEDAVSQLPPAWIPPRPRWRGAGASRKPWGRITRRRSCCPPNRVEASAWTGQTPRHGPTAAGCSRSRSNGTTDNRTGARD